MAYITYEYYREVFCGALVPEEVFPRLSARAGDRIDALTMGKAAHYLEEYPQDDRVKKAVCAVMDQIYRAETGDSLNGTPRGTVQTEIVGKHHITYLAPMETASEAGQRAIEQAIRQAAATYLGGTGLLYRGAAMASGMLVL